jgi:hypothetical protein
MKRPPTRLVGVAMVAAGLGIVILGRASAPAGRYTIANGTVYDTKTKLTWQQGISATTYTQADASTYCSALPLNGVKWRLPTMRELTTIVDLSVAPPGPTIDSAAFPGTPQAYFWSSTPYSGLPGSAWSVHFYYGFSYGNTVTDTSYARCVR